MAEGTRQKIPVSRGVSNDQVATSNLRGRRSSPYTAYVNQMGHGDVTISLKRAG